MDYNQQNGGQPQYQPQYPPQPQQPQSNSKAVASLVLGIAGLVCIFFGYGAIVGIVLSIIGIILGTQAKKEAPSGMATAGIVCSIIALALCAVTFLACVACVGAFASLGAFS